MDSNSVIPWTLIATESDWKRLLRHLFPGDDDEHGAVLLCGVVETSRCRRLLVREVCVARDGIDYVAGEYGYRALTPAFVARLIGRCSDEQLAYVAVHNHRATTRVGFSQVDIESHERGYPALLDIANGGPVGALVLGTEAVAGDIWTRMERKPLAHAVVLSARRQLRYPVLPTAAAGINTEYDRQVRIFGDIGQQLLSGLRIAVVGAGGAGSMLIQALTHLGVGELVVIEPEVLEPENLPRVVGASPLDARRDGDIPWRGTTKIEVARRMAMTMNPQLRFYGYEGNVIDESMAHHLLDCDAVFLSADTMQARRLVNAVCHQYLIPGFQVGAKVVTDHATGRVADAFAVARVVMPGATCMWCSGLIDATQLQLESLRPGDRDAADYGTGTPQPSVITMNAMSTAWALNDFLFMFTGLHSPDLDLGSRRYHFLTREAVHEAPAVPAPDCPECLARKARGDRWSLPTRTSPPSNSSKPVPEP